MSKIIATLILITMFIGCSAPEQTLVCRDGKAFWKNNEGNITVFTPTYNECEVLR